MENQTMIKVEKETANILKKLRVVERESYNEIIIRLLEDYLESKLELNKEMKKRLEEIKNLKKEDMFSSEEALQYLKKIKGKN